MSEYEDRTYRVAMAYMEGWYTMDDLRGAIQKLERMNEVNRQQLEDTAKPEPQKAQQAQEALGAAYITGVMQERERLIQLLATTEFTSLEHMPHEAAAMIRAGYPQIHS